MEYLQKYGYVPSAEGIASNIQTIAANLPDPCSPEILKTCFSLMDLTTLRTNDTEETVKTLVEKANGIADAFPGYPLPASICVYPNFAHVVAGCRKDPALHVTTVAGCFPSSQSFPEVKALECRKAVEDGADEVDIVLSLGNFLAGDEKAAHDEIVLLKSAIDEKAARLGRKVVLKVILETGLLVSPELIAEASFLAMEAGADEVDIVLSLGNFLAGDEKAAHDEIVLLKSAIDVEAARLGRKVVLKVILETGLLVSPELIAEASFLAMEAGADFIKTSTGKVDVNATPTAAYVMCECIRKYHELTGRKVGFKAAGGISTAKDALCYYYIVLSVLGGEWLCKDLFRFGVSRLGNSLVSAIEQKTVNYF